MTQSFGKVLQVLTTYLMLSFTSLSFAKSVDSAKLYSELAFRSCLSINYKNLGVDIFKNDFSYFHPRYLSLPDRSNAEYDARLGEFLIKYTSNFYKEEISVKSEGSGPHNVIFAKCAEFVDSKIFYEFIKKNNLPVKPSMNE